MDNMYNNGHLVSALHSHLHFGNFWDPLLASIIASFLTNVFRQQPIDNHYLARRCPGSALTLSLNLRIADMEPKEHYTSKDFKRYARKEFPNEYAVFRELYLCNFENKTYFDINQAAHNLSVLLVGQYCTRQGGPAVWAQATATCVRYFSGKDTGTVCTLIPEKNLGRIYYSAPYSSIGDVQENRSGSASRKAGTCFVETIINVLFLLTGQLEQVSNPSKIDMLSNFRYVCMNAKPRSGYQDSLPSADAQDRKLLPAHEPVERVQKKIKRERVSSYHGQRIKQEEHNNDIGLLGDISDAPIAQSRTQSLQDLSSHMSIPHRPAPSFDSLLVILTVLNLFCRYEIANGGAPDSAL